MRSVLNKLMLRAQAIKQAYVKDKIWLYMQQINDFFVNCKDRFGLERTSLEFLL